MKAPSRSSGERAIRVSRFIKIGFSARSATWRFREQTRAPWGYRSPWGFCFGARNVAIPYRLAIQIWERDGECCRYCGDELKPEQAEIDHHNPRSLGGTDDPANLWLSCMQCNRMKSGKHPRVAMLWLVDGVPLCVAYAIHRFEQRLDPLPGEPWFTGASYVEIDGVRKVTHMPYAMGSCERSSCPDCAS